MHEHYEVGRIKVSTIVERQDVLFEPLAIFPNLSKTMLQENLGWLKPKFIDPITDKLIVCIQSYLIRTPHHTILVDTCVGNHKPRPGRGILNMQASARYERNLVRAGLHVEDVDFVMCTHLHLDHVGWNTRLQDGRWRPTFPNARYILSARELEFWNNRHQADPALCPWIADSILPIIDSGQVDLVVSDHRLTESVHLEPTPGHTIDHYSVRLSDSGRDAMITGDIVHSPIQMRYPEIGMVVDYDQDLGTQTRRRVLEEVCETQTLFCTAHFPAFSAGYVTRWGDGFRFEPLQPRLTPARPTA